MKSIIRLYTEISNILTFGNGAVLVDPNASTLQQDSNNNEEHYDVVFMIKNQLLYGNDNVLS